MRMPVLAKFCGDCGQVKELDNFPRCQKSKDGAYSYCHPCNRKRVKDWRKANRDKALEADRRGKLRKRGITPEQYQLLIEIQGGRCAICRTDNPGFMSGMKRRFDVDHDHETGRVRGLLCQGCNLALGQMRSDPLILRAAADYLDGGTGWDR